jgi:electron transfer flavoprotein beta subunit
MNPYDLYALESAFRLKEQYGGTVTVITMGPPQAAEVIREAYAMGADAGVLVSDRRFAGADVLATSYTLSQAIEKTGHFQIILCGKQTTDGDTAQVGCEISEYLRIPSAANVTAILDAGADSVTVEMDMPATVEVAEISFPCLLCVDKGIYQPRLPSYTKKQQTKDRAIPVLSLDDFQDKDPLRYGLNGSPTQVQRIFPPEVNDNREIWRGGADELSAKLAQTFTELKFVRR